MQVSATDAKSRFGYYLSQADREPVQVMKNDGVAVVMVSAARYAELEALERTKTLGQRKREFNETYRDWIRAQTEDFDKHGLWCDGVVAWQQE